MGNKEHYVTRPALDQSPKARARARFLINGLYSDMFGKSIRHETVRSIRVKIIELEANLERVREFLPMAVYKSMVRQVVNYERVCEQLEVLS